MRHHSRYLFTSVLVLCALGVNPAWAQNGFTPLFNGKDLSGWVPVGTPDAFKIEKGAILSTGASPYPSWLRTEMPYENFVLRLEYQTLGWYEGGILIHAPADGPASQLGFQVHLRHDRLDYQARSPGAIYDVAGPLDESLQWKRTTQPFTPAVGLRRPTVPASARPPSTSVLKTQPRGTKRAAEPRHSTPSSLDS